MYFQCFNSFKIVVLRLNEPFSFFLEIFIPGATPELCSVLRFLHIEVRGVSFCEY